MPLILIPLIAAILSSEEPFRSLRYPFALAALLGSVIWLVTFRTTFTDERTTATVQRVTVLGVRWSLAWWFHPMPLDIKGVSAPEAAAKTVAFSILARETFDSAARFRTTQQAIPIVHAALLGLIRYGQLIVVRRDTTIRGPLDWRDTEHQEYFAYPVEGADVAWRGGALETTIMAALRRGTDPWSHGGVCMAATSMR